MKKNIFNLFQIVFLGLVITSGNVVAQCGSEPITITPWCENTYAKWSFNNPTPNSTYYWYNYQQGPFAAGDFYADGRLKTPGTRSVVLYDSVTTPNYTTQFRLTTAAIPSNLINLTYIKKISYGISTLIIPSTAPVFSPTPQLGTFNMNFTTTSPIRFNSVRVPVRLNTIGKQYKIQIQFGSTSGQGSAIYSFSTVDATLINGNNYFIEIPINYDLNTIGSQTLVINTNPTGGSGAQVDGLLYSTSQFLGPIINGPVTIPSNAAATGVSGGFSVIYDWKYTQTCAPQLSGESQKTSAGCCVVPASATTSYTVSSSVASIVNNGATNATISVGGNRNVANYFGWYLNGVLQSSLSGFSKTLIVTNKVGIWEVREVGISSDLSNSSCYATDKVVIEDKKIFLTTVSSPTTKCLGDQWKFSGTGSSNLTWSSGAGIVNPTSGPNTTFTAASTGNATITLTGQVTNSNLVLNGDFTSGASSFTVDASLTNASPGLPTASDGSWSVVNTTSNNPDWNYNAQFGGSYLTGTGNFLIVNGPTNATSKPLIWGQKIISGITTGNLYNFSFDFTSLTYMISDYANNLNYTWDPSTALPTSTKFKDIYLDVLVNGVSVGTVNTDFAINKFGSVHNWKNYSFPWTANSSQASLEIRLLTPNSSSPSLPDGRGYDFVIDNIAFGGISNQTDVITVGPITDCSTISASSSACQNDSLATLTATLTGGLVFDHWEQPLGTTVGVSNPLTVITKTAKTYRAFGFLASGNVLDNGDFENGNTGFSSPYAYAGSNPATRGYTIATNTSAGNGSWQNITQAPGQSTISRRFVADVQNTLNDPIVNWTFSANQNDKFAFTGYVATQHNIFSSTIPVPDTLNSGHPAKIGVFINNVLVAKAYTGITQNWVKMTATWVAPTAGTNTYTLEVRNLQSGLSNNFGNDLVLDGFVLAPGFGSLKFADATTPVCDPCLNNIAKSKDTTFCLNTANVSLTPSSGDLAGVQYNWYATSSSTPILGTTIGSGQTTLDVSGITANGAGNKIVYYSKSAKGSGMIYPKSSAQNTFFDQACGDNTGTFNNQLTALNVLKVLEIDTVSVNVKSSIFNLNDSQSGTVTVSIWGEKTGGGVDAANVVGTYSAPFSRTRTTASQDVYIALKIPVNKILTNTGRYFIGPSSVTRTGQGNVNVCAGASETYPKSDNIDGSYLQLGGTGTPNNTTIDSKQGYIFDIKFSVPAPKCPRIPVTLTPLCPCAKPTAVNISPNVTFVDICAGTNATALTGTFNASADPIQTGGLMKYVWYKKGGAVGAFTDVNLVPAANATNVAVGNLTPTPTNLTATETWVLRVEDFKTATNSSCYTEDTLQIRVKAIPTFTTNQPNAQCGGTVDLANTVKSLLPTGATLAYYKDTTATALTSSVVSVSGTYYVKATTATGSCSSKYKTGTINVTINSTPTFTIANPASQCAGNIDLSGKVSSLNPTTAVLNYRSDSTATGTDITSTVTTTGTYYVRAAANGCSSKYKDGKFTVVIDKKPSITTTAPSAVCAPSTVSITGAWTDANSTNPTVTYYQGATSTGGTLITATAAAAISASGTYSVKGVNGTCSDEKTVAVTINSAPSTPTFRLDPNKTSFCVGDVYELTAESTLGSTFKWDNASTTAKITGNSASGTYTYEVVATLNGCSSAKGTQGITVNVLPTVASVVASKPKFCSGGTDKTQVTLTFTGAPTFEFTYNGTGTPTSTGNVSKTSTNTTYPFDVTTAETFKVIALKDGNGCVATALTPSESTSFFENPEIDTVMYKCDPTNSAVTGFRYQIIFKGKKGDVSTYKIDATDFTTNAVIASQAFVGNTWTSNYIDENVFVNLDFYDVNKCATIKKPKLNKSCSCPEKIDLAFASGASTGSICEQGDSTSIKLTIVPTANGSGAVLADFKYKLVGPDNTTILATEATPQPIRVNKAGKYVITDFTGKCTGTNDDLDVLNYTSPIAGITASDADFCLNGTDKGEVQLQVTTQSKPDYTFVVSRTAMTDTTISLVGVTSATFKTNKAVTYTIKSVKDGNTCTAIPKNGSAVMKGIIPPVGKITSPASTPTSYRDNDFGLTADALTADYRGQWLADSVGVLIGDTTTNTVGLRIPSFDNTKTIQWVVRDVNRVCPKDVQTVVITRKDFTVADIEPNKNVCIVPTTNFTLKGNPFTAATETASWSVKSGNASVLKDPSDNSKATFVPTGGAGEYEFYYAIFNSSLNKTTKDSIKVRVDAESVVPTISLLTGPYDTAPKAYKICAKDYTLPGVASTQGTLSRNWWEKVTGTGDITPSDSVATPTLKSISGLVELKYMQKNGVCPAKDMPFFVDKVGDISVPKITITGGKLTDLASKQYNNDSVTALIPADTLCFGGTYTITGTKLPTETGAWSVLSGTSVGLTSDLTTQSQSLTINPASAIPTKLKWSITNGICPNPNTIEVNLVVHNIPTQPIVVGNPICEGIDSLFKLSTSSTSTLPVTYNWSAGTDGAFRVGTAATGTGMKYKFSSDATGSITSGTFDVTAMNRCGSATKFPLTVPIKLAPRKFNVGDTINGPKTFCATSTGVKYKLNRLQPNTTEYVWRWNSDVLADNDTSTLVIGKWATDANSTATVTVEIRNQCSATGIPQLFSQPLSVTITKLEPLGVTITSNYLDSIFCVPQTQLEFTATAVTNLLNLAPKYKFKINGDGSTTPVASTTNVFKPAIGAINDNDIVSVDINVEDDKQCLVTFSNSDDILMQGFNFPDSTINMPQVLKICEDGKPIVLHVIRTKNSRKKFNDNSISWYKDGKFVGTFTTIDTVYKLNLSSPSETGVYSVRMARHVCADSSRETAANRVVIYEKPQFSFNIDPLVIIYQEGIVVPMPVSIVAPTMADSKYIYSYRDADGDTTWLRNPDDSVALIVPKREQKEWYYTLKVTNGDPAIPSSVCETSRSLRVINSLPLTIPNAFSPNGDGVNDTWVVNGLNRYTSVKVSVFNRWGNRVFYDNSGYKEPWDGNINGVPLATGTYYAILELSGSPDNTDTNETRSLTIVR